MREHITKGVDDEIEFKGFKGRYFYQLVGAVVGLLMLLFLLYIIGFSSIFLMLIMGGLALFAYTFIKARMQRNGRHGHIHSQHDAPDHIIINKPFYRLLEKSQRSERSKSFLER